MVARKVEITEQLNLIKKAHLLEDLIENGYEEISNQIDRMTIGAEQFDYQDITRLMIRIQDNN